MFLMVTNSKPINALVIGYSCGGASNQTVAVPATLASLMATVCRWSDFPNLSEFFHDGLAGGTLE